MLVCKKDNRQEALEHDRDATEVYKECSEDSSLALVGHVLTELTRPVTDFLGASKMNSLSVQDCGTNTKLVSTFLDFLRARMKKSKFGNILTKEIEKNYRALSLL